MFLGGACHCCGQLEPTVLYRIQGRRERCVLSGAYDIEDSFPLVRGWKRIVLVTGKKPKAKKQTNQKVKQDLKF